MDFSFFLVLALVFLFGSWLLSFLVGRWRQRKKCIPNPLAILSAGVALASFVLYYPVKLQILTPLGCSTFEVLTETFFSALKTFTMGGSLEVIASVLSDAREAVFHIYMSLAAFLFLFAPLLSLSWALSFFKNLSAQLRYGFHFYSETYIFSELNQKALFLAESLYQEKGKDCFFVFTNVADTKEERAHLIERAKKLGAACMKKDILSANFSFHSRDKGLHIFCLGEDESKNVTQALSLIDIFRQREHTNLYVFSTGTTEELLLANALAESGKMENKKNGIKVRRIDEVRSLINRTLFDHGFETIFGSAQQGGDGIREIGAVVLGMGRHGTEMTKALPWFGQMDGYRIRIDSFEIKENAEDTFSSLCPELVELSGKEVEGEAAYSLHVHAGIDVFTDSFDRLIKTLPCVTTVFISLGSDECNLAAAIKMRTICARKGCFPKIHAIVRSVEKRDALTGITNYKKQKYDIDFIGDIRDTYSAKVILDSDLEEVALNRHLKWGVEEDFWRYDYNYRSSVASAIHHKMKVLCKIPGAEKAPHQRSKEETLALRVLEHRRWNAYIRSEGYIYGGTTARSGRDDLAKTHNCLVPFGELPLEEQEKDDD